MSFKRLAPLTSSAHEVVQNLLRLLDSSFDTLALMIQERADYKSLDPADILERLNTHEFQLAEKRDLYGSSYGKPRALKAKAVSESEDEDSSSTAREEISEVLKTWSLWKILKEQ